MARSRRHSLRGCVVCGTDFTDAATKAATVAARLATALKRPLLLVHVTTAVGRRARLTAPPTGAIDRELRAEAARLRAIGAAVTVERHAGHADDVLTTRARDTRAALLVIGALGTRLPTQRFLGSVAERATEIAAVPTLVVRHDGPFDDWLRGRRALRVVVAYDFTVTAEAALAWAGTLPGAGPCEMTLAHLNSPPTDEHRFGVLGRAPAADNAPRVQELLERQVRERARTMLGDHDVRVDVRPVAGPVDLALVGMALDARADLIVVGTHQRRGLARVWSGSISRGVLAEAPASVAVVPVAALESRVPPIPALQRVLVATDLGRDARRVIAYGCGIASPGGTVRIVTMLHPRAVGGGQYDKTLGQSPRHARHAHAIGTQLESLRPTDAHARGIDTVAAVVEAEDPVTGICQEAERFDAEVIAVGTKGIGLTSALIGSVAQGVVAKSRRPVLVVNAAKE